jgi:hypothetical protein
MSERIAMGLKATALVTILVTVNLLAVRGAQQTRENEPALSTVYGRAIYHGSEQPVRRVNVVLRNLTNLGPEQLTAITNARGEFRIEGVPAGRYFIGVNGRGVVSTDSFRYGRG